MLIEWKQRPKDTRGARVHMWRERNVWNKWKLAHVNETFQMGKQVWKVWVAGIPGLTPNINWTCFNLNIHKLWLKTYRTLQVLKAVFILWFCFAWVKYSVCAMWKGGLSVQNNFQLHLLMIQCVQQRLKK